MSCISECGDEISICVTSITSAGIALRIFLPRTSVILVRSTNPSLLNQRADFDCLYSDPRLSLVQLVGPGVVNYTDTNVIANTNYFYRLLSVCGRSWQSDLVHAYTPFGSAPTSFTVVTSCAPSSGYLNLTVTFGTVPTPLYSPLYYLLSVGGNSIFVTATPNGNNAPTITATQSPASNPVPTITATLNPSTGIVTLTMTNLTINLPSPTTLTFAQTASNGTIISGPTTYPITIGTCSS